jgi:hypothetical protein
MLRQLLIVFALLSGFVGIANAAEPSQQDRATIQQIIADQIAAFRADDGQAAYGHASPLIRQIFPTPELFMSMVRQGYPQVYRPQKYKFGKAGTGLEGAPTQHVIVVGPDGKTYEAVYTMELQPSGEWKINGCAIVQLPGLDV